MGLLINFLPPTVGVVASSAAASEDDPFDGMGWMIDNHLPITAPLLHWEDAPGVLKGDVTVNGASPRRSDFASQWDWKVYKYFNR